MGNKPKIMISFRGDGVTGGPNNSHKRIMESALKEKYDFVPLFIPKGHLGIFNLKVIKKMAADIKACNPDIVHFTGLELVGWYGCLACKAAGVKKTLMVIRGSTEEAIEFNKVKIKKYIMKFIEFLTLKNTEYVYGVSEYVSSWIKVKRYAKRYFGNIYNLPIKKGKNKTNNDFRKEYGFSDKDIIVVSTGRIEKEKGFETLKNIIIKNEWDNNVKFVIVGDGSFVQPMKAEIYQAKKEKAVYFTGFRTDIENILESSDVFVTCTKHETLCNSVIEACQYGLPVIASCVGGVPEIIKNGENGFLTEPDNENGFANIIKKLISDKDLRKVMGKKGTRIIAEKFNEEKILSEIDSIYQIILKDA